MVSHCTLHSEARITGVGLHCGESIGAALLPREEDGIVFVRSDLPGRPQIPASFKHIGKTYHATALEKEGATVSTPEHLMAALWGLGISRCVIELDGPEVPILDGSALPWCELIEGAGIVETGEPRREYILERPVMVESKGGAVLGLPHPQLRVTADVEYGLAYLPPQVFGCDVNAAHFREWVAPARTFTLESWIEPLRQANLIRGGSMENAVILGPDGPLSPLRFETELARHKALDLLGDAALLCADDGGYLKAHLTAIRGGHELHRLWMREAVQLGAFSVVEPAV